MSWLRLVVDKEFSCRRAMTLAVWTEGRISALRNLKHVRAPCRIPTPMLTVVNVLDLPNFCSV